MSTLKQARLVKTRKSGRWAYYSLTGTDSSDEVQGAIAWLQKSLSGTASILQDERRLREVLILDVGVLCSMQHRGLDEK